MNRIAAHYSGGMTSAEEPSTNSDRDDGIQVLRRAAAALDEIAAQPGALRLVDLGPRLGLAKSTVRRLMVGLTDIGFASVDDAGRFALGNRLLGLSGSDHAYIAAAFRPVIERVAEDTGETVDLSVLHGGAMRFIDQIESAHRLRAVSAVGAHFPLPVTANGKAALALLDETPAELSEEIAEIRSTGIAFDVDEHTAGISAAGIAGFIRSGQVVAISVPAPSERFAAERERIVAALHRAAKARAWRT